MKQLKINSKYARLAIVLSIMASIVVSGLLVSPRANAITTSEQSLTQAVSQSYNAAPDVELGMIVGQKSGQGSTVTPLTEATISTMLGVVVSANDSTVTLTPAGATQKQIFVVSTGRYDVLVSNQNGPIKTGDLISVSSLAGIGMKANQSQAIVLGRATESFNGTSNVEGTVKLSNSAGQTNSVAIGTITVNLSISHNPLALNGTDYVPSFISKVAVGVTDKPVSAFRIYLGVLILVASSLMAGSLLFSGVRSGMQAIGRNPLSKKSILRSLYQTVFAGLLIFIVGIFAIYLLLKL